jgi:hypothetical protein
MTKYLKTNKKTFRKESNLNLLKKISHFKIFAVSVFMIFSSVGFYVWLITESAVKNYEIRDLQAKIEELQKENRQLEVASAGGQSATSLNSQIKTLGMESTDKVDYITVFDKVMVKR